MMKKYSVVLLSTFFLMNSSLYSSQVPSKDQSPASSTDSTCAPAASAAGAPTSDTKTAAEKNATVSQEPAAQTKKQKLTLQDIIDRRKGPLSALLPEAMRKSFYTTAKLVTDALENLKIAVKADKEEVDFDSLTSQNLLGKTIQEILASKDFKLIAQFIHLAEQNQVYAGPSHSKALIDKLKEKQTEDNRAFQEAFEKHCKGLRELYDAHVKKSDEANSLIDKAYNLGGKLNYLPNELLMKQGVLQNPNEAEKRALQEKQKNRHAKGIVDNNEKHPVYVDSSKLIGVKPNELYTMQLGAQSINSASKV